MSIVYGRYGEFVKAYSLSAGYLYYVFFIFKRYTRVVFRLSRILIQLYVHAKKLDIHKERKWWQVCFLRVLRFPSILKHRLCRDRYNIFKCWQLK